MENTMLKEASALLDELLASRIDAAGAHCPPETPEPGDEPDDGDEPDEPPGEDPYPSKPGPSK
jgi:hypothetical protein